MLKPLACKHQLEANHAELYDILVSNLTDYVVFLMDPDGCIMSWNPGVERTLGYSEPEWLGRPADIIFTPEDRVSGKPQQEISSATKQGHSPDIRWHLRKDGTRLFVEGTLVALRNDAGQLLGFSKVMLDITERKKREAQLHGALAYAESIVDTVHDPLLVLDKNFQIRSANRAFYRTFKVSKKETENKRLYELGNGQWNIPQLRTLLEQLVPQQTTVSDFEVEHDFPDLGRIVMLFNARRFSWEGNHTDFILLAIEDVTYGKRAEERLRKSEERWRSLFEGMAEGFFVAEMIYNRHGEASDFRFLEVNPAFEKLTGLADATGKTMRELVPSIQDEVIQNYAQVVSTGEPAQLEIFVPALQNTWYEARARRSEPGRFAVLFLNITERKNNELYLRGSERRQAALVTLGDRLRDLKGVAAITLAAMEIVGTTLGLARAGYGKVDSTQEFVTIENDWTNGRIPTLAGTYRFKDFGEELQIRLRRGQAIVVPDVCIDPITAKDSERWKALDIRAVINLPLVENGRLVAILFIQDSAPRNWSEGDLALLREVADRTWIAAERARASEELQESEEFTRSVLASSPDCVNVISLDGHLLTMNDGGCRQMELDNLALHVHNPWADSWGEMKAVAEEALTKARDGQITRFEGYCPTAKGTPKWWEVVVTPILDAKGEPVRILSLSRDITERQRAEQERERLTRELKRSNEDLSQFAHTVAHDLQSPLRGVITFAQLLQRKAKPGLTADDGELLKHIVESGYSMQELVQALLRFAQIGQGEIEKKPVEMNRIVDAASHSLQVEIEERGATITRGMLPVVMGDPVQILQLLQNMMGNALKYSRPSEPPRINITAAKEEARYVFAVQDNGEGIAPEHQNQIFEPLKRLHGHDVPGTGLGLAMCRRIVARHGGRIRVESEPGVGSTFYFTLPGA